MLENPYENLADADAGIMPLSNVLSGDFPFGATSLQLSFNNLNYIRYGAALEDKTILYNSVFPLSLSDVNVVSSSPTSFSADLISGSIPLELPSGSHVVVTGGPYNSGSFTLHYIFILPELLMLNTGGTVSVDYTEGSAQAALIYSTLAPHTDFCTLESADLYFMRSGYSSPAGHINLTVDGDNFSYVGNSTTIKTIGYDRVDYAFTYSIPEYVGAYITESALSGTYPVLRLGSAFSVNSTSDGKIDDPNDPSGGGGDPDDPDNPDNPGDDDSGGILGILKKIYNGLKSIFSFFADLVGSLVRLILRLFIPTTEDIQNMLNDVNEKFREKSNFLSAMVSILTTNVNDILDVFKFEKDEEGNDIPIAQPDLTFDGFSWEFDGEEVQILPAYDFGSILTETSSALSALHSVIYVVFCLLAVFGMYNMGIAVVHIWLASFTGKFKLSNFALVWLHCLVSPLGLLFKGNSGHDTTA